MTNSTGPQTTTADVINAATDVLDGLTSGTLSASAVERRAVDACRDLFAVVGDGPADPLWTLHGDTTRQYLAAGGLSADELTEWVAVQRRREQPADADA